MKFIAFVAALTALTSMAGAQTGAEGRHSGGFSRLGVFNPDHVQVGRDGEYIDGESGFNLGGLSIGEIRARPNQRSSHVSFIGRVHDSKEAECAA